MVVLAAVARRIAQDAAVWWVKTTCIRQAVARVVRWPFAATLDQSMTLQTSVSMDAKKKNARQYPN